MKKEGITAMNCVISWLFLLYFAILFAERAQSLIRAATDPAIKLYGSGFDGYVNTLTMVSLLATLVLLLFCNSSFWHSLFDPSVLPDYTMLTLTAGVLLFSGMVHTEHTVAPIQFVSYGMLIVAMVLKTVLETPKADHPFTLWYSLVYLTVFSMAIPVMYRSQITRATLFHVVEAVTAILLVCCFTLLLRRMFTGQGQDLLLWVPMVIAAVGDAVILALRWKEQVNWFVLIFIVLSAVLFVVGKLIFLAIGRT